MEPEQIKVQNAPGDVYAWRRASSTRAIMAVHGFTGSGLDFESFAASLPGEFSLYALDLAGHGSAAHVSAATDNSLDSLATSLSETIRALSLERPVVLGYSMGGRVALHHALRHPDEVGALVLVGAKAGLDDAKEREARRLADERLADEIEARGLGWFLEYWSAHEMIRSQRRIPQPYLERWDLRRSAGAPVGLASSLRNAGLGAMEPLWSVLSELEPRTLFVCGEQDERHRSIAQDMAKSIPNGRVAIVPGCGHAANFEEPSTFAALFLDWLRSINDR